ncbi:MAG TPA: stage II sporulation protein M [Longilinea sp.]|nr:stage II sporulation protein M [Longilinea sp.]
MADRFQPVWIIAKREIRDQFRDWRIIFPIVILTLGFPFLMNFTAQQMLNFVRGYGADIVGERLVPFLMMIVGFFPLSASLVIALDTFVGEKERGSIEPLLNTPLKDWQLYAGKLLAAIVPSLFGSFLGMSVYLGGLALQGVPLPEFELTILILLLTMVQAVVMVSGAVVVSSQATSVRAANLLSSFIIIPVALLIQGESILMFWGTFSTLWWTVFGLSMLSILLVRVGLAHFKREELLGREIDVLNFRWGWKTFRRQFAGGAKNLADWYLKAVPAAVKRMSPAILLTTIFAVIAVIIGILQLQRFPVKIAGLSLGNQLSQVMNLLPVFSAAPVLIIWLQNIRVQVVGLILGIFSFSILGFIPIFISMAISGYLVAMLVQNGVPALPLIVGLFLPHSIFEIPAIILSTSAVFQLGVLLATANPAKTVGEVWISALADWAKIIIGLVLPLLLIGAAIEAWITPRIALLLLH